MAVQKKHSVMKCQGTAIRPVKEEIDGVKVRCVECGYEFVLTGNIHPMTN